MGAIAIGPETPLGDTGSANHLIGRNILKQIGSDSRIYHGEMRNLITGKGNTQSNLYTKLWIPQINQLLEFLVLEHCPLVISQGRLLQDNKWTMVWKGGGDPIIYDSNMKPHLKMSVHKNCPFFDEFDPDQKWVQPEDLELLSNLPDISVEGSLVAGEDDKPASIFTVQDEDMSRDLADADGIIRTTGIFDKWHHALMVEFHGDNLNHPYWSNTEHRYSGVPMTHDQYQ